MKIFMYKNDREQIGNTRDQEYYIAFFKPQQVQYGNQNMVFTDKVYVHYPRKSAEKEKNTSTLF